MLRTTSIALICLAVVLAVVDASGHQDSVRANPNAVKINRIWSITGSHEGQRQVGMSIGSLGDINGDSLMDFGVVRVGWTDVFLGGRPAPSNIPFQSIDNSVA